MSAIFGDALERYMKAFDESPPVLLWAGSDEDFAALVDVAIMKGEPISEAEILRVQGRPPIPEDALY